MTRAELLILAERVEAAEGANEALNEAIWTSLGNEAIWTSLGGKRDAPLWAPAYTASLDAAASLVPEGWGGKFWWTRGFKHPGVTLERSYPSNREVHAEGRTLPNTMTAAALRARAEEASDE
jgi:hypothetical protein